MIEQVKELISKQLKVDIAEINDDSNVMEDIGADSLDIVELLMSVDDTFGVKVPDEDVASLKTVRDIADYIEKNKA